MQKQVSIEEFLDLRSQFPIADVRSPKEFTEGHIQSAVNIPILNNDERKAVGTDYKQKGKEAAVRTGIKLVGPRLDEIVEQANLIAKDKKLLVHCWRGGMRSANFFSHLKNGTYFLKYYKGNIVKTLRFIKN